ncbi:MAG: hypothetical protein ACK52J_05790 [bacterium]
MPQPVKKSPIIVLNLVYPDLKSAPATHAPYFSAKLTIAGCKVF